MMTIYKHYTKLWNDVYDNYKSSNINYMALSELEK